MKIEKNLKNKQNTNNNEYFFIPDNTTNFNDFVKFLYFFYL